MMKTWKETAELSVFLICLCLGFAFSFEILLPALHDIQMEMMRYLFGVGFGFGLGICFFLIWIPILHLMMIALEGFVSKFGASNEGRAKRKTKEGNDDDEFELSSS